MANVKRFTFLKSIHSVGFAANFQKSYSEFSRRFFCGCDKSQGHCCGLRLDNDFVEDKVRANLRANEHHFFQRFERDRLFRVIRRIGADENDNATEKRPKRKRTLHFFRAISQNLMLEFRVACRRRQT